MYKLNETSYTQRNTVEQNLYIYKICFSGYKNDNVIKYKEEQSWNIDKLDHLNKGYIN